MIVAVIRILLLALRRAGFKVPTLPGLRLRPTLIERALADPGDRDRARRAAAEPGGRRRSIGAVPHARSPRCQQGQ